MDQRRQDEYARPTNRIRTLSEEEKSGGVIAFSSGNHAQAVALASMEAGVRAVIAMPSDAPKSKIAATNGYGAEVIFYDRQRDDREAFTSEIAVREKLTLVPPFDDYRIMAGQGTCALELLEEIPDLQAIVTPCGGGGLFAGASTMAKAINPEIRCFAVEAETANDTQQSFRKGQRVSIPPPPTIADGMRNQAPGELTFPILQKNAEDVLTVSDDEIVSAMRFLLFRMKMLTEPTGAASAAAVASGKLPPEITSVGVILSGGNIDPATLLMLLEN